MDVTLAAALLFASLLGCNDDSPTSTESGDTGTEILTTGEGVEGRGDGVGGEAVGGNAAGPLLGLLGPGTD